jgi:hypothetical protein
MSQTEPSAPTPYRHRIGERLPNFPGAPQLAFLGTFLFCLGFVAYVLAFAGHPILAPKAQAAGYSGAGLSLLIAAGTLKIQKVITNVAD